MNDDDWTDLTLNKQTVHTQYFVCQTKQRSLLDAEDKVEGMAVPVGNLGKCLLPP